MERDFMGLNAKVKEEEFLEDFTHSARGQSSTMQWTFSNKGSGPQYLSFDSLKNEKPKTGFEALASAGLLSITTSESSNILQKQGGSHHAVTTFPQSPFDSHSIRLPTDNRKLPVIGTSNQTVALAMSYPPTHNSFVSSANPQPMPITPRSVQAKSANNPVVGTTELRNTSKTSEAPAQLTIFYAGSVCVYDDISPEKAQAIMLLAGNRPSVPSTPLVPTSPVQMPTIRPSIVNSFDHHNRVGLSCLSNPISGTTISSSRSGGGSVSCNDAAAVRTIVTLQSPPNKTELPKTVNSIGFAPPTLIPHGSDVPQYRKSSLARFLVKRKERVLSASPYPVDTKQSKECNTTNPGSSSKSMPVSSSAGSCALPAAI